MLSLGAFVSIIGYRSAMQVDGSSWDVYGFDAVDQITSAKYQSASSSGVTPQRSVAYDWDAVSNRETVQTTPASGMTTDVYATAASLQNASTSPAAAQVYDSSNRLLSVQSRSATVTSSSVR